VSEKNDLEGPQLVLSMRLASTCVCRHKGHAITLH